MVPTLVLARPNQSKPPLGAQLDRDHPLARDLLLMFALNEFAGIRAQDATGRTSGGILQPGALWGKDGLSLDANNAHYADLGTYAFGLKDVNRVTIEAIIRTHTTLAASQEILGNNTGNSYLLRISAGGAVLLGNASTTYALTTATLATSTDYHIVALKRASGAFHEVWVNGASLALTTNANVGGLDASVQHFLGLRTAASFPFGGVIRKVAVYNRDLRPEEIRGLYAEPWVMFRPAGTRVPLQAVTPVLDDGYLPVYRVPEPDWNVSLWQ